MNKLDLIKRNTQEIVTEGELKKLLSKKQRAYIGIAPTGNPHIGYLVPLVKAIDLAEAGVDVTCMIADLHAHLDNRKTSWDLLDARSKVYEIAFKAAVKSLGGNGIQFVRGSTFEKRPDYFIPVIKMAAMTTLARSKRAASEVIRFGTAPNVGGFLYPLMQTQDIVSLKADIVLGGIDQRGIYMLSREILSEMGQKKPVCIFTPLLPGLSGGKMSATVAESKINLTDSPTQISQKAAKAYCPAGSKENNGVLLFFQYVIIPWLERKKKKLKISRPAKFGGDRIYKSYSELEKDFLSKKLHPADLKGAFAFLLNEIIDPIRKELNKNKALLRKAYS